MASQTISARGKATKGHLEEGTAFAAQRMSKAPPSTEDQRVYEPESTPVVVIGASQAGLAVGYYLKRRGIPFVILDAYPRVGDRWRSRWDSLRLFTPRRLNRLPGMHFPRGAGTSPTKDEMADYLERYSARFDLPVRTSVEVTSVGRYGGDFEVVHRTGRLLTQNVVIATGACHHPRIPTFADTLDDGILQMHSSVYQRPSQLQSGDVLIVGAGNSGAEIALDLAADHHVYVSGPDVGHEPTRAGTLADRAFTPIIWFAASQLFKVTTPVGRKVRDHFTRPPRGIPLGRVRRKDLLAAGIELVPRTIGIRDGRPLLEGGGSLDVSNVVWCTGFVSDFRWINFPIFDEYGYPAHYRGVVESVPGLYFMGLPFQYALSSALVGGVGRDARYVVEHLKRTLARAGQVTVA